MNKKGWGIDLITLFVLLFVVVVMVSITSTTDPVIKAQQLNTTNYALNWSHYNSAFVSKPDDGNLSTYIINIVYKFIDTAGYCLMTLSKLAVNVGLKYPEYNWKLILYLILFMFLLPVIYYIIQIGALLFVIILEIRARKKDKEEKQKWKQ